MQYIYGNTKYIQHTHHRLNYYRPVAKREIEIVFDDDIWKANLLTGEIRNNKNEIIFSDLLMIGLRRYTYTDQMKYLIRVVL